MNFERSLLRARSPIWRSTKARIDGDGLAGLVGGGETHFVEDALHHRLQSPRSDIFDRAVDFGRDIGERRNAVFGKIERYALCAQERDILLDETCFGLGKNAPEIFFRERLEFDTDRQSSLQFGKKIGRLGDVEGARRNKQDVIAIRN